MKKTLQSVMTAAMFAAAATAALGTMENAGRAEAMAAVLENQTVFTTTAPLYGPPPVDYTDEETTDCEQTDTTMTETTTTVELQYPLSIMFRHGDLNCDERFDARDLTLLKQELLRYQQFLKEYPGTNVTVVDIIWDWERLDVNNDNEADKEDIMALRRMLTGKSKEQEEAEERARLGEETTTATTGTTAGTTTSGTTTFNGPTQTWPTGTTGTTMPR